MAVVNLDTAARLDIICRRGDSFSLAVEFDSEINDTDPLVNDGAPDEAGANDVWIMTIRETVDSSSRELDSLGSHDEAMTVEVDPLDSKKLNITNSAANMKTIEAGLYVYDVQRSTGDNSDTTPATVGDITTYLYGTFEVREDVTNEV